MHLRHSDHDHGPPTVPVTFVLEDPEGLTGTDKREWNLMAAKGEHMLEVAVEHGVNIEHACGAARPADLFIRKAPAGTIGDLARAVAQAKGVDAEIKVLGTRHGEKLYETLATREELTRAEDQGAYYRVSVDARDLNYGGYFEEGERGASVIDDYHSHNAQRLDVDGIVDLLKRFPDFRR